MCLYSRQKSVYFVSTLENKFASFFDSSKEQKRILFMLFELNRTWNYGPQKPQKVFYHYLSRKILKYQQLLLTYVSWPQLSYVWFLAHSNESFKWFKLKPLKHMIFDTAEKNIFTEWKARYRCRDLCLKCFKNNITICRIKNV